jgi:hypothetical protein
MKKTILLSLLLAFSAIFNFSCKKDGTGSPDNNSSLSINGLFYNVSMELQFPKSYQPDPQGAPVKYMVPAGKYSSAISQAAADQLARNELTANAQKLANANGIPLLSMVEVQIYASGDNQNDGAIPTLQFQNPSTGMDVYSFTITSSEANEYVDAATYNIVITQTDNKSFSASIPGYGSRSGQTLTFDSVAVTSTMSIYITDK